MIVVATIVTVFATAVSIVVLRGPVTPPVAASEESESDFDPSLAESEASENVAAVAEIAHLKKIDHECPPPTKKQGGQCILVKDEVIDETLDLGSFTHLNCKGFKLSPATRGAPGNVNSQSVPEVGVVMNETFGSKLQNCYLDGFDFGVFVLKNKLDDGMKDDPGTLSLLGNKILGNTIVARFTGISLMEADNTEIKDNEIVFTTASGRGVAIQHNSDMNAVRNNTITGKVAATGQTRRYPGPANSLTNPIITNNQSDAILIAELVGGEPTLANFIVGGQLEQFATKEWLGAGYDRTEADLAPFPAENIIEGNEISYEAPSSTPAERMGGVLLRGLSYRTTVRENLMSSIGNGVIEGFQRGNRMFPGVCSNPGSQRACLTNADCMIPAVDNGVSQGTCTGNAVRRSDYAPVDTLTENNKLIGPLGLGFEVTGRGTTIRNNTVTGPSLPDGATQWAGIALRGLATESSTVTGNSFTGIGRALRIEKQFNNSHVAGSFGAKIYKNDFVGTDVSIYQGGPNTVPYDLQTELSAFGTGNYWGRSCDDSDGFRDVDEAGEDGRTDSPLALITDSHPFGVPVASLSTTPATCK